MFFSQKEAKFLSPSYKPLHASFVHAIWGKCVQKVIVKATDHIFGAVANLKGIVTWKNVFVSQKKIIE